MRGAGRRRKEFAVRRRALLGGAALTALAVGIIVPTGDQATAKPKPKPRVKVAKTAIVNVQPYSFTMPAADEGSNRRNKVVYVPEDAARCPSGTVPLSLGWSGSPALVTSVAPGSVTPGAGWTASPRIGDTAARARLVGLCARGLRVSSRESAQPVVTCPGGVALGLAAYTGSYVRNGTSESYPVSINRWQTNMGDESPWKTRAICAPRRAFASVKLAQKSGRIAAGRTTTTLTVACPVRHRALTWGFRTTAIPGYVPTSLTTTDVPYVTGARPVGKNRWAVRFSTPDGRPAAGATPVSAHTVCAVPR